MIQYNLLLLFFVLPVFATANPARLYICRKPGPLSTSFCKYPPVVPNLDLKSFTGVWYQVATAGYASRIASPYCSTARYKLSEGGLKALVCQHPPGKKRVSCIKGKVAPRSGGGKSHLTVTYGGPRFGFNVIALLARPDFGYFAAVVYHCLKINGKFVQSFAFLTREPSTAQRAVSFLVRRLKCSGFDIKEKIKFTDHGERCDYFFNSNGFKVFAPKKLPGFKVPPREY